MSIDKDKIKDLKPTLNSKDDELVEVLRSEMDGADYEQGVLEDAARTAEKGNHVLAKLIVLLKQKNILNDDEIVEIFKHIF